MSITGHHAEWLLLLDVSGPFLSVSVLADAFPNGLDSYDSKVGAELHAAYEAWSDPEANGYDGDPEALHSAFVSFVLQRVLGLADDEARKDEETLAAYTVRTKTHEVNLRPDAVVVDGDTALMLVRHLPRGTAVDQPLPGDAWTASPRERMAEHLREASCPLGLVTDGEHWTLVHWSGGEVPGYATWWASLWREERLTLRAFHTLLGHKRFFSVPEEETLPGLLDRSSEDQSEVTTKLGRQTLEAVEILVRTIDRLDRDRGGKLLEAIDETELYDAAVTVMMRLILLFFAEENDLLPMAEDLYVREYAASTLRAHLQEQADQSTEQVLETRSDGWQRLIALWRAVYTGVEHGDMRIAPYGGSLFDPDRYSFLEGRLPGSTWREDPAVPLPIDNRTVLHILSALQTLDEKGLRRRLPFSGLDVEQIGHVYEGMLDHTAKRATVLVLGLSGTGGKEPEIPLEEMEALAEDDLVDFLKDRTGRGADTVRSWLGADVDQVVADTYGHTWTAAFGGDAEAALRVKRFAKFVRADSTGGPTVFHPGSVYVCDSSHRGATGTHYTPLSFTREMVAETLDPLVYEGIAEGWPEDDWKLRPPQDILALKVGDPACGSGAFLVQACRYLSAKLVESRTSHGEFTRDPTDADLIEARREVAGQCLYGVDVNSMAVEMAKLSLWLVTLDKNKPFSFVDHAVRVGDSLFGLSTLDQLRYWSLSADGEVQELFADRLAGELEEALALRRELESFPVLDSHDATRKADLLRTIEERTEGLRVVADALFAPSLASESAAEVAEIRADMLEALLDHEPNRMRQAVSEMLGGVRPFHWPLEFPEVFDSGGFDALVGNPPFMGGKKITGILGSAYREYLVDHIASGTRGSADLVAYFLLRAEPLLRPEGLFGLMAVNTVAEGDTRRVALEQLLGRGSTLFAAHPNEAWPNESAVFTSRVHLVKGPWAGVRTLAGTSVPHISPFLTAQDDWSPARLSASAGFAYIGSVVLGTGFVLREEEASGLLALRPKNREVVLPYLNGNDLNQNPHQAPSRWIISFWDWPEARARTFAAPFGVVEKLVLPDRIARHGERRTASSNRYVDYWWQFGRTVPGCYHAIGRGHAFEHHTAGWDPGSAPLERVVVTARVTKYWAPSLVLNTPVFAEQCVVFACDSAAFLALSLSCVHSEWAWAQSLSLGATGLRYTPSDCFETFPLPVHGELPDDPKLDDLGERFHMLRRTIMKSENIGLTTLYNRFHDREDPTAGLAELRRLQTEIDHRVMFLYDWTDVDLDHDFRDVPYLPENDRLRYTISEVARLEVLDRLGRLNRARYEDEVANGLHDKSSKNKKGKKVATPVSEAASGEPAARGKQRTLFAETDEP